MVGQVGEDDFGRQLRAALGREGVDDTWLVVDPEAGTGVAAPVIEAAGAVRAARAVLLQLEVPPDASLAAARLGRAAGVRVLLNTAPTGPVPEELLAAADVLIANEIESAALSGVTVRSVEGAFTAATRLRRRPGQTAVVTLGADGAVAVSEALQRHVPAYPVPAVDTTGAGDAFCAALAVRLTETADLADALAWANAAGACAVTVVGAEPSLPARASVEGLIRAGR